MTVDELVKTNILEVLGVADAPEEEQKEVLQEAVSTALDRVVARVAEELPDEKRKVFLSLFEGARAEEKTKEFIEKNVSNFEELFLEEILNFKIDLMKAAAAPE